MMILIRIAHESDFKRGPFKGKPSCDAWEMDVGLMDLSTPRKNQVDETIYYAFTVEQFERMISPNLLWDMREEGFVPYIVYALVYYSFRDQAIFNINECTYELMNPKRPRKATLRVLIQAVALEETAEAA